MGQMPYSRKKWYELYTGWGGGLRSIALRSQTLGWPAGRQTRRCELRSADSERPADQGLRENRWRCPRNARALTNRSGTTLTVALTRTLGNMVHQNPRVLVDQFATTLRTIRFTTFRKAFVNFWGRSKGLGPQPSFKNCFRLWPKLAAS